MGSNYEIKSWVNNAKQKKINKTDFWVQNFAAVGLGSIANSLKSIPIYKRTYSQMFRKIYITGTFVFWVRKNKTPKYQIYVLQ